MPDLLAPEDLKLLSKELVDALREVDAFRVWLRAHYTVGLAALVGGQGLAAEIVNVTASANAEDGMRTLLQRLADNPPGDKFPMLIYAYTHGEIRATEKAAHGLPPVSADQSWFAANRPFVNRGPLRAHLRDLANSVGEKAILVINGQERTGKSFTVTLLSNFQAVQSSPPPLDIDEYARVGAELDARELVTLIVGDDVGCPAFDITKEDEAVPRLVRWLVTRVRGRQAWIIIDHCNRRVLTAGARRVLLGLAQQLRTGLLPGVRLILIDFDRAALPLEWRDQVRFDEAQLPSRDHVEHWCKELAVAAHRRFADSDAKKWAQDVFAGLDGQDTRDGSWHAALERELRKAVEKILACETRP